MIKKQPPQTSPSKTKEKDWSSDIVRHLRIVFEECDLNHDGVIQKKEIDDLVKKHYKSPLEAQIVALFSHCFDDICALHKEGWFSRKNGITINDLFLLENLISNKAIDNLSYDHKKLKIVAQNILKRTDAIWKLNPRLYGSDQHPVTSIRAVAVRRGNVGNCYLLSCLAAVANTNPKTIEKIISINADDSYRVTFPGKPEAPVRVSRPTIVELSLYGQLTRMGYWPCVIEKAFHLLQEETDITAEIPQCLELVTGSKIKAVTLKEGNLDPLVNDLDNWATNKQAMVVVSKNKSKAKDSSFYPLHPFTVMKVNQPLKRITLRDPYGPSHRVHKESGSTERPRAKKQDGIFSISIEELAKNFDSLYVEDVEQ